ncbi:MAG: biotin/lipoyl-binding protein [Calditrichaeota bacterium]|nr:MAG: biotin/lipoyl-binding protein [Calditrichota bacterium]
MGERHHLVYIARSPEAIYLHIDGQAFRLEPVRESREARSSSEQPAGQAERNITAPMPGKILKLMVREGQQVSAGEGLFILEAMKMENEVRAPQQAVVEKIHVQEGELVSVGEVVLELHYPENDQSGN